MLAGTLIKVVVIRCSGNYFIAIFKILCIQFTARKTFFLSWLNKIINLSLVFYALRKWSETNHCN